MNEQARRKSASRDWIACVCIVTLAVIVILPVFIRGFPAGFDAARHYRWTSQFIDALRDGSIYPRWLPTANDGQGSPAILYYPPLPFYVSAGFSLIGGNVANGMSLSCWLALAISGLGMYAFSRSILSPLMSFTAAALYMMAPYHLLDLYQGSTVSEFWSFVWLPFLLDGVRRVSSSRSLPAIGYLAAMYALLALTHVPVLFLTSMALAVYAVSITRNPRALLRMVAGLASGAGLAAVFLIPAMLETKYVKLFFKFDYRDYFQFENLRGAFASTRFPADGSPFTYLLDTELVAVALVLMFVVSSFLLWLHRRSLNGVARTLCVAVWVMTCFGILMTTRLSSPLWRCLPGLSFLFFPYRWLVVGSCGTCFLFALAFSRLRRGNTSHIVQAGALAVAAILSLSISAIIVRRASVAPDGFADTILRRDTREYRPVWWFGQLDRDVWENAAALGNGDVEVRALDGAGIEQRYEISAKKESAIVLRPLYFPGWVAKVDGEKRDTEPSSEGHIQMTVRPGEHALELSFEDTSPRFAGKIVSAVSALILLALFVIGRRRATGDTSDDVVAG